MPWKSGHSEGYLGSGLLRVCPSSPSLPAPPPPGPHAGIFQTAISEKEERAGSLAVDNLCLGDSPTAWKAEDRSRLWPPLATHKAIWSTCWMGSPIRVPPASSQGTCSSSLAVVSPPKGKREEGGQEGGREARAGAQGQPQLHAMHENIGFSTHVASAVTPAFVTSIFLLYPHDFPRGMDRMRRCL